MQPYDGCGVGVFGGDANSVDAGRHAGVARLRRQLEPCLEDGTGSKVRLPVKNVKNGECGEGDDWEEDEEMTVKTKPCQSLRLRFRQEGK